MIQLKVNGAEQSCKGKPEMPLLWYLRGVLGQTASKFANNAWAAFQGRKKLNIS